jgi:hypothetical protein
VENPNRRVIWRPNFYEGKSMLNRIIGMFRRPNNVVSSADPATPRNFAQEREDRRTSQLSDEDKAWGAASQQKDKENRERTDQSTTTT